MNNPSIIFHAPFHPAVIISIMLVACMFFLWKEYYRPMAYRFLRIAATVVMWASLAGIVLKPGWTHFEPNLDILLTDGYRKTSVDSLLQVKPAAKVYHTQSTAAYSLNDLIISPDQINANEIPFGVVAGIGLPLAELMRRDSTDYFYVPGSLPEGIVDLSLPEQVVTGRTSQIQGTINTREPATITLLGPGGPEDSVTINHPGQHSFTLRYFPKVAGRFLYHIKTQTSGSSNEEVVPVVVQAPRALNILVLQQFPTAEARYLKNLLGSQGHQLIIRYQISRANFRYEYANQVSRRADRMTADLLAATDLLICNPEAIDAMSRGELDLLASALHDGLGMLLLLDEVPASKQSIQRWLPIVFQPNKTDTLHLNGSIFKIAPLQPAPDQQMIEVSRNTSRVASGYTFVGSGKSGFQLLHETYRLLLRGEVSTYTSLWVPLIEQTARKKFLNPIRVVQPFPLLRGDRLSIELISPQPHPTLSANGLILPLQEDVLIDDVWQASARFDTSGWQQLNSPDSIEQDIYVHPASAWKGIRHRQQIQANQWKALHKPMTPGVGHLEETPTSPLMLFILFLIAAGFLWLAPKL
jgi:hypothetical protein